MTCHDFITIKQKDSDLFIEALHGTAVYFFGGGRVPGFTFLTSIIAIFSGVQLFSLGIIGEYIERIHQQALHQPCYIILEITPISPPEQKTLITS